VTQSGEGGHQLDCTGPLRLEDNGPMLFDETEPPYTSEELAKVRAAASIRFQTWRRRTLYAATAFVLSCLSVYRLVDGHHLSTGEETAKQVLLLVWVTLLMVLLYCSLLLWGAFRLLRNPVASLT
jgi:hypothetical protein